MISKNEKGTIVVPWNFLSSSRAALDYAMRIADDPTDIRILHVAAPLSGPDNGALYESAEKQKRRELEARFHQQITGDDRLKNIPFFITFGSIRQEVVRFAERQEAILIVMAPRERKGVSRFLFRHLTERIVRIASCPVLVLQGENGRKAWNHQLQSSVLGTPQMGLPL